MINVKDARWRKHADEGVSYIPIFNDGKFSVSYVFLKPGETVPKHRHKRTHHLYFAELGDILVIVDGKKKILGEKCFLDISPGKWHEVINNSKKGAQFITFEVPPDDNDIEMFEKK